MNLHSGEAGMYGARGLSAAPSSKPATIAELRDRMRSNRTRSGLMAVANAALAQGEATFRYAQHCDLGDALIAVREASQYGEIAAQAITAANAKDEPRAQNL